MKNFKKFNALLLALVMVLSLSATALAAVGDPSATYGTAEIITGNGANGNFVTGNDTNYTVVTLSNLDLNWSPAEETLGRNQACCWAGIWMHAPEGVTSGAKYQTWGADGWSAAKDWVDDNGEYSQQLWVPVTAESLTNFYNDGYDLRWFYNLDWNGDGTYEQMLEIKVVPNPAVVIHDENGDVAWSIDTTDYQYTITINNAVVGETYKAYKIFDVTYTDTDENTEGPEAFSYTISTTNPWFDTVAAFVDNKYSPDADKVKVYNGNGMTLTQSAGDPTVYVVTTVTEGDGAFSAVDFAAALNAANKTGKPVAAAAVATSNTVEMNVEYAGYYFVDTSLGSLCSLDTTTPNVEIFEKNTAPSIKKEVASDLTDNNYQGWGDGDVIDTINYRLTVNTGTKAETITPEGTGVDANYVIVDTLPTGITYNDNSIAVKVGDTEWTNNDYTVAWDATENKLVINLLATGALKDLPQNTDIIITYLATMDKAAVQIDPAGAATGNTNNVTLTYHAQESKDKAVVYTYQIGGEVDGNPIIQKVDGSNNTTPLAGVKFILSKEVEGTTYYANVSNVTADTNGSYYLNEWTTDEPESGNIFTGEKGEIIVKGLDAGEYILTEVETLPGYNLLTDTITVTITPAVTTDENGNATANNVSITYKMTNAEGNGEGTITIVNNTGTELPSTGGIGTTIFYVLGGVLVLGAAILIITRRRMSAAK